MRFVMDVVRERIEFKQPFRVQPAQVRWSGIHRPAEIAKFTAF
jgi:hypothetical protein